MGTNPNMQSGSSPPSGEQSRRRTHEIPPATPPAVSIDKFIENEPFTAIHEAGHALCAHALVMKFAKTRAVTIKPGRRLRAEGTAGQIHVVQSIALGSRRSHTFIFWLRLPTEHATFSMSDGTRSYNSPGTHSGSARWTARN